MATGKHPFKRDNNVSTLSAILTATPAPVVTINDSLPQSSVRSSRAVWRGPPKTGIRLRPS